MLSEVSCTALDGEIVALVGPNGAGKSTLLRAMAGVLEGAAVHGLLDVPQRVSYCPDSTLGFLDLSIAENLELMMLALDREPSTRDAWTEALVDIVDLPGKEREPLDRLSAGMLRRLDIVLSVCKEADLYLFDEPYNGLDAEWIRAFSDILEALRGAGKTSVVATHVPELLLAQATQIWTLAAGALTASPSSTPARAGSTSAAHLPWLETPAHRR